MLQDRDHAILVSAGSAYLEGCTITGNRGTGIGIGPRYARVHDGMYQNDDTCITRTSSLPSMCVVCIGLRVQGHFAFAANHARSRFSVKAYGSRVVSCFQKRFSLVWR